MQASKTALAFVFVLRYYIKNIQTTAGRVPKKSEGLFACLENMYFTGG